MAKKTQTVIRQREINPVAAAILNFIIWGTGYIYNGKRLVAGIGLLIAMILVHAPVFYLGIRWYLSIPGLLIIMAHFIISLSLAYDAYHDAKA